MVRFQWLLYSLVLTFLTACVPAKQNDLTTIPANPSNGIVGGTEITDHEELPNSTVAVYDAQVGQLCSGTLINRNVVLTAAHCIGSDSSKMYVVFGKNLAINPIFAPVDKLEISPYYAPASFINNDAGDIALLHFAGVLPSGYQAAQMLPLDLGNLLVNSAEVVVAGYGVSDGVTLEGHKILRKTTVKISDAEFGRSEILVDQSAGRGVCHGDSGGPAFIKSAGQYYLWGVTSRGVDDTTGACATSSAFTSTVFHRTWINRMNIKLSSSLVNFSWRSQ